jgi:RNA methyltransferase, TrmH family
VLSVPGSPQSGPTSVRSQRVTAVRRLANGPFRRSVGRFLIEGPQAVREAVAHRPDVVDEVFVVTPPDEVSGPIARAAAEAAVPVTEVPEPVLLAMTETVHPQGIAAVGRFLDRPATEVVTGAALVVLLDQIRDPGNAGTVLRTADAAGADGVILSQGSVDPYNGKCVRSTAGSLFHVPFAADESSMGVIATARAAGLRVLAATGAGATSLVDADLRPPTLWVFGNEARGLDPELVAAADERVSIPIYGRAESLNLAAAAAVCLYASAMAQR